MKMKQLTIFLLLFYGLNFHITAQSINHWETVIYNNEEWRFQIGASEPPTDWMQTNFNDQQWSIGIGGFGYGDDDDNTNISNTVSVYLRKTFDLQDTSKIVGAILHADYDDAFVAYLNGVEFARSNIGQVGTPPPYNMTSTELHEATLFQGGLPESFTLSGNALKNLMVEGNNTLSIQVHNESINSSDLSSNFFFSVGITDESMTYGATPSWFDQTVFSSHLPLVIIQTTETNEIYDEPRVLAHLGIVDKGPGQLNGNFDAFNGYDGQIAIEIRGASSQSFPKKNYGFETQNADGSNNNVSLLGMPEENDWVLHGPYTDKTLLRNELAYYMARTTGRYAPRTRLCELIINGDYRGVYMMTERIKRDQNRVDIAKLNPEDITGDELTGGYILQIDRDDDTTDDDGWFSNFAPWKFYAYDDPDYDVLLPVQRNYIRSYINNFELAINNSNYESTYTNYVDIPSWVDYFLITEVGKHIDAYKLSFFMYKKKESNGGKLHFGPIWDFNLAFANFDFDCSSAASGWAYQFGGTCHDAHPFWVRKITEIPAVSHLTDCRWNELRAGPLHTDSLMQFIDERVLYLAEAQSRNFNRWPIIGQYVWPNSFVGNTYEEEIAFLKNWLTQRLNWMDNNMIGDCEMLVAIEEEPTIDGPHVYPNPITDQLIIDFKQTPSSEMKLVLYDLLGKEVNNFDLTISQTILNLQNYNKGWYLYVIRNEEETIKTGKLVKL